MALSYLRPAPDLRDACSILVLVVVGARRLPHARRRQVPQDRLPAGHDRDAVPRRLAARRRDRRHAEDRGGGQHGERPRHADVDVDRGRLARDRAVRARDRPEDGGAGHQREDRDGAARPAAGRRAPRFASADPDAAPVLVLVGQGPGRAADARADAVRRQAGQAAHRAPEGRRSDRDPRRPGAPDQRRPRSDPARRRRRVRARGPARDRDRQRQRAGRPARDAARRTRRCASRAARSSRGRSATSSSARSASTRSACATSRRSIDSEEDAETSALAQRRPGDRALGAQAVRHQHGRRRRSRQARRSTTCRPSCRPGYSVDVVRDNSDADPHVGVAGARAPRDRRAARRARRAAVPRQPALDDDRRDLDPGVDHLDVRPDDDRRASRST